jgi:hypothetical protein
MSEREWLMCEPTHEQLSGAIYAKLLKIEEAILRFEAQLLRIEARQITIKDEIQEQPKVGSFASTDQ